jgi:hypothetical protein
VVYEKRHAVTVTLIAGDEHFHLILLAGCIELQALQERGQKPAGPAIQLSTWAGEQR